MEANFQIHTACKNILKKERGRANLHSLPQPTNCSRWHKKHQQTDKMSSDLMFIPGTHKIGVVSLPEAIGQCVLSIDCSSFSPSSVSILENYGKLLARMLKNDRNNKFDFNIFFVYVP